MSETDDAGVVAHRWIELYNEGEPGTYGSDRFLELYADDCLWVEMPSAFFPEGRTGNKAALREALSSSESVMIDRHVDLHDVIADGNEAAMRYTWSATLNADGTPVPKGTRITGEVAAFLVVRNGKIVEIRELLSFVPA
ncbi:MAG TPA: nuclear transport factor 2 family protein [Acidimicrobiales bacterium]